MIVGGATSCKFPRLAVVPFIDEMDAAYGASDLVVARAGAITCAELVATGTPAILVPSPNVAEDHQTENALALADAGCAAVLPEREMASREFQDGGDGTARPEGASTLARLVSDLLRDPERMRAMAAAAVAVDTPRAAEEIANDVARVARR